MASDTISNVITLTYASQLTAHSSPLGRHRSIQEGHEASGDLLHTRRRTDPDQRAAVQSTRAFGHASSEVLGNPSYLVTFDNHHRAFELNDS